MSTLTLGTRRVLPAAREKAQVSILATLLTSGRQCLHNLPHEGWYV